MTGRNKDYTPEEYSGVYAGKGWTVWWHGSFCEIEVEGVGVTTERCQALLPSQELSVDLAAEFYEEHRAKHYGEEDG